MAKTLDIKKFHERLYDVDELIYDINDYVYDKNKKKYEIKFMDINNLYLDRFKMPNYDLDIIFKSQQITHLPEDNYPSGIINNGNPIDVIGFVRINKNLKTNIRLIEYSNRLDTTNIHNPINVNHVIKTLLSELVLNDKTKHILLPIINFDAAGSDLAKYPEIKSHIDQDKIYSVEITERFFKMVSLDVFLKENELDDYFLVTTLSGIIEPLYEINTYYPKFKHNYLLPETIDCYIKNNLNSQGDKLVHTNVPNIKLSNFYLSEIEDVIYNEYLVNSDIPVMGSNFPYNDIYMVLNDIWKKYSNSILKTSFMTDLFQQLLPEKIRSDNIYLTKKMWDTLSENEKDSLNIKNIYGNISKLKTRMKDEKKALLKNNSKKDESNSRITTKQDEESESDINVNDLSPEDVFDIVSPSFESDILELSNLSSTENSDTDDVEQELARESTKYFESNTSESSSSSSENSNTDDVEQEPTSKSTKKKSWKNDIPFSHNTAEPIPANAPDYLEISRLIPKSDDVSIQSKISSETSEIEESGIKTSSNKNIKSYNNDINNMSTNKKRSKTNMDNVDNGQIKLKKYKGKRKIDPHIGTNLQKKKPQSYHQNYENGYMGENDNFDYSGQMDSGPKINSIGNFFGVTPNSLPQYNNQFGQKFNNQSPYAVGQFPPNQTKQVPAPINNENDIINRYMAANAGNMSYSQPDPNPMMNQQAMNQQAMTQQMAAQQAMMQQAMQQQAMAPQQMQQPMPDQQAMMDMMQQNQTGGYNRNPNFFFQH